MSKEKLIKTNAMRILDSKKISYEMISYPCNDGQIDGISVARKIGEEEIRVFKTLVAQGGSKEIYVYVIPVAEELDLKKSAIITKEKKIEMIHVKDITKVTGYVRGGCSPLGMKKLYPTVIHDSALAFEEIYVSGGRIGTTLKVNPEKLAKVVKAQFKNIIAVHE